VVNSQIFNNNVGSHIAENIITSGIIEVQNGTNETFQAGTSVILTSGFHTIAGSNFLAKISTLSNCAGNPNAGGNSNGGEITVTWDETQTTITPVTSKIYPNPTSGIVNIEYILSDENEKFNISVTNSNGQLLQTLSNLSVFYQKEKDFKNACNAYFDRMHEEKNAETTEEVEAFEKKKAFLEELKDFALIGEHKADLDAIKAHIATWKSFGKVPNNRRHIEGKFNKILDALFEKLSMSKKDTEMMRFSNRLEQMNSNDDKRALEQEQFFIRKKIDEVQGEIFQLENNIQFISSSSKGENPFIKEVQKSIERHKDDLKLWKDKLQQIKNM
jgi:hypothetical protein